MVKSAYKPGQRWKSKGNADGSNKVYLIDIRKFLSYNKNKVKYKIIKNSEGNFRYFLSGLALAAYLGTLCKLGYKDISFNGFSTSNGDPGESSSHINDLVGDMRYLRKDFKALAVTVFENSYSHERSLKLVETLYVFGFGRTRKIYTERYSKPELNLKNYELPYCEHYRKGTVGDGGYERLFGGRSFVKDYSRGFLDHPRIDRPFGKTTSSAAGAYQVTRYTWDDKSIIAKRKKYGITSFGKRDQDLFAVILMKYARPSTWPLLLEGKIKEALKLDKKRGYAYEWASLPPGRYGQPSKTMVQALGLYDKYFKEENNGKTDLHIEYGFLKKVFND